jgi:hypothetical protein
MHSKFTPPGLLLLLCLVTGINQRFYSAPSDTITKNRFSFGANFVYNLSSDKKIKTLDLPRGTTGTNFAPYSNFYLMKYRYPDTRTFNLNLCYHEKLTKKLSFSFGLGLSKKKEVKEYLAYVDSPASKPDPLYQEEDQYSIVVPLRINYYFRRFIFSAGNNFNFTVSDTYTDSYDDQTKQVYKEKVAYYLYMQESVSYRLLRRDHLYVTLSAEQSERFYYRYGYNHWFMLGFNWYFK